MIIDERRFIAQRDLNRPKLNEASGEFIGFMGTALVDVKALPFAADSIDYYAQKINNLSLSLLLKDCLAMLLD